MKPKINPFLRSALIAAAAHACSLSAQAGTYYWDPDGTGILGFGTAGGTWGSSAFWNTDSTGGNGGTIANTTITTADDVNFGTASAGLLAGTVTGPSTAQGFLNMTFGSASGAIVLSGGMLNLDTSTGSTITVNNASDTISTVLQGTGGKLIKAGTGTLTLTGNGSTYSGSTTIKAGTLVAGTVNGEKGISGSSSVLLGDTTGSANATLQLGTANSTNFTNNVRVQSGNSGVAALNGSGNINLSGTVTLGTNSSTGKSVTIANVGSSSSWIYDLQGAIQNPTGMTGTGGTVTVGSTGVGTVRFSGANTYTGDTRLAANNFQIYNANALQNSTLDLATGDTGTVSAINQNSTLGGLKGTRNLDMLTRTLSIGNNNQNTTYSGVLSNGALTKIGSGTLTLSGANNYTGTTTVSGGILEFKNTGGTTRSQTLGALTLAGGGGTLQSTWDTANSISTTFTSLTARSAGNSANIVLSGGTPGTNNTLKINGGTAGNLIDRGVFFNGSSYAAYGTSGVIRAYGSGDTNYVGGISGANAIANDSTKNVALSGDVTGQNTAAVNTLNLGASSVTLTDASQILSVNGILSAGSSSAQIATAGILQATAANNEIVIRVDGSSDKLTIAPVIQNFTGGTSSLTKSGAGTLVLGNTANTYTGKTYISGGVLQIANADTALGTAPGSVVADQLTFNGGTLQFTGNTTLATNRGITLGAAGGAFDTQANTLAYGGIITGSGAFTKTGSGSLTFNGTNTYTGTTTVTSGTLKLSGALRSTSAFVVSGTLDVAATNVLTSGHSAALNAPITINAGGVVSNSNNSVNRIGDINLNGGTLTATYNEGNYGSYFIGQANGVDPTVTVGGSVASTINSTNSGNIKMWSNVNFNVADVTGNANADLTVSAVLGNQTPDQGSAAAKLTKSGSGTMVLTAANNYTGATTINTGTLKLQNSYASSGFAVASGAVLELNVSSGSRDGATTTFSGTGTLRKTGAGSYVWGAGVATFALGSGSLIDVQEGTFTGGSNGNEVWSSNLSDLNVANGATFSTVEANVRVNKITGTGTIKTGYSGAGYANLTIGVDNGSSTFDGAIQNANAAGNLVKAGSGTIALTGNNTYTGTTTVSGGTLSFSGTNSIGAVTANGGNVSFTGGATAITGNLSQTMDGGNAISITNSTVTMNQLYSGANDLNSIGMAFTIGAGADVTATSGVVSQTWRGSGGMFLNGGTLRTSYLSANSATQSWLSNRGYIHFNGTKIVATANQSNFIQLVGGVNYGNEGFASLDTTTIFDTAVYGIGIGVELRGTGGLSKDGAGTLTLSGTNTYSGLTTVNNGALATTSTGSLKSGNALTLGASGTADFANAGQTLGAVSNGNTASNALNFSASTGTVTLASLTGAGNTRFGSNGTVTGGISTGTVNAVGALNANISGGTIGVGSLSSTTVSGGTTTVSGIATIGTMSSGNANLNGATSSISTLNGGTVNLGSSSVLTVNDGTTSGTITGSGGLTKDTSGTLTLSSGGTFNYGGATTVNDGKLVINGNISTSSLTTVKTGATVGGSGTVGALAVDAGAFIAPGNSPGIFSTGDYNQAGTLSLELNGTTAGTAYDQVSVTGSVNLSGALAATVGYTPVNGQLLFILLNDSTDAISGTFSGLAQGATVTFSGYDWQISYNADSTANTFTGTLNGNDIALRAVPEPDVAALLGGLGVLALLRRRR